MKSQTRIIPKSRKQVYAKYAHRWPKSKKDEAEFGLGKKEFIMCSVCEAVYCDKSWKHSLDEDVKHLKAEKQLNFSICPACRMIKDKKFEGQIILERVPEKFKKEIKNAIANMAKEANERDCQDRVWKIDEQGKDMEVLTTENQLAVRIAKKIAESFMGKLSIQHADGEDIMRARLIWRED